MRKHGREGSEQEVQLSWCVNTGLASIPVMTTLSHNVKLVSSESLEPVLRVRHLKHTHTHTLPC